MPATTDAIHFASRHIPIWRRYAGIEDGRVVRVGLGDSNQIHSGHGYDYGEAQALVNAGVPMTSTHLDTVANNGGAGSGMGLGTIFGATASAAYSGAPADVQPFLVNPAGFFKHGMLWTANQNNSTARGLESGVLPAQEAIRGHVWYVQSPAMGASWSFAIRRNSSPFTTYGTRTINQNAGPTSVQRATLDLAADAARAGLGLGLLSYTLSSGLPIAPMAMLFMAMERTNQARGFTYDSLVNFGGNGLRQYYNVLVSLGQPWLTAYFSALLTIGGANPVLEFNIRSGLNDRNDAVVAHGSTALSNTEDGYAANLVALMNLLAERAMQGGWEKHQIYFRIRPSHVADVGDASQAAFRRAARAVAQANDRAIFIDDSVLFPHSEISAYYQGGGSDANHLTQAGHLIEAADGHESFMRAVNNAYVQTQDIFAGSIPGIDSPPAVWSSVTPNDHYDVIPSRCLWIGGAGNVVVIPLGSQAPVTFNSVAAGTLLPGRFRRVLATGTTATAILSGR
jgi:hypothetical protein